MRSRRLPRRRTLGRTLARQERAARAASLPADPVAARAFVEGLFARHHGEINAYLVRMLRDPELAADLTQDAFIRAYRAHADLDDLAKARAWLYQIAHRVALDEIRRRKIIRFVPWTGESRGSSPSAERMALESTCRGPRAGSQPDPRAPTLRPPAGRGPGDDRARAGSRPRHLARRRPRPPHARPREPPTGACRRAGRTCRGRARRGRAPAAPRPARARRRR